MTRTPCAMNGRGSARGGDRRGSTHRMTQNRDPVGFEGWWMRTDPADRVPTQLLAGMTGWTIRHPRRAETQRSAIGLEAECGEVKAVHRVFDGATLADARREEHIFG